MSDILTDSGRMKSCRTLQNQNVTGAEFFVLMSVFNSIPSEWKTLLRDMPSTLPEAPKIAGLNISVLFQILILATN